MTPIGQWRLSTVHAVLTAMLVASSSYPCGPGKSPLVVGGPLESLEEMTAWLTQLINWTIIPPFDKGLPTSWSTLVVNPKWFQQWIQDVNCKMFVGCVLPWIHRLATLIHGPCPSPSWSVPMMVRHRGSADDQLRWSVRLSYLITMDQHTAITIKNHGMIEMMMMISMDDSHHTD